MQSLNSSKKCKNKLDCLIFEMLFNKELKTKFNKQCDSICLIYLFRPFYSVMLNAYAYDVCVSEWKTIAWKLNGTKFNYRVMYECIELKLKIKYWQAC